MNNSSTSLSTAAPVLSVHRVNALTDGIYAVAMTLLVIELKLPEPLAGHSEAAVVSALVGLLPKVLAWVVSFFVMALFWMGHHRLHDRLRQIDRRLLVLNIVQLGGISLMPFSCALQGEHGGLVPQIVFAANMALLALLSLAMGRHVFRHPELCAHPLLQGPYRGIQIRVGGLVAISALTVGVQALAPSGSFGYGNMAFMLMAVLGRISRRAER